MRFYLWTRHIVLLLATLWPALVARTYLMLQEAQVLKACALFGVALRTGTGSPRRGGTIFCLTCGKGITCARLFLSLFASPCSGASNLRLHEAAPPSLTPRPPSTAVCFPRRTDKLRLDYQSRVACTPVRRGELHKCWEAGSHRPAAPGRRGRRWSPAGDSVRRTAHFSSSTVSRSVSDEILLRIMELLSEREMRLNFFLHDLQLKCSDLLLFFKSIPVTCSLCKTSHKLSLSSAQYRCVCFSS